MGCYKLQYLPAFYEDLDRATSYIAEKLHNPQAAIDLMDDIENAIQKRLPNAESFEQYHSKKERRYPYYRIYVKNYVVYYVVIGNIMEVRRLLHELQDSERLV